MRKKEDIINEIIKDNEYVSYLEIGFGNGYNFNKINCDIKLSCDTNGKGDFKGTSDEFFEDHKDNTWDLIFIDGLHTAEQVRKDIINALKCNAKCIILHDTLPPTEGHQIVPRKQTSWTGDVWRAVVGFKENYPDVNLKTYKADYGLTVIHPEGKKVRKHFENTEISYEYFKENAKKLLNIID